MTRGIVTAQQRRPWWTAQQQLTFASQSLEPALTKPEPESSSQQQPVAASNISQQQQLPVTPSSTNKFAYYLQHIRGGLPLSQPAHHLLEVYDPNLRIALTRFRTSCHDLRIERERYLPKAIQAPTHERTCLLCASPAIEDETHMVFHCPPFTTICALSTQISSPLICPRPSHAFCPKTRIELLHLSMTAMFYAAAMRV